MAWIRSNKKGSGGGTIPYVATCGEQVLPIGVYDDDYPVLRARVMLNSYAGQQVIIGDGTWNTDAFVLYIDSSLSALQFRYSSSGVNAITNPNWCNPVDIEIDYSTGTIIYDGVTYTGAPKTQLHNQITLCAYNSGGRKAFMHIFSLQVYKNGTLYRDLVPMQDSQTGAGYLHDTVNNTDYYSTNQPLFYGEFSAS